MSIWKNLQSLLRPTSPPQGNIPGGGERSMDFNQDIVSHLQYQADAECRSPHDLAQELLAGALAQRRADKESLERWRSLSPREQEVTALTCLGYTNLQIARRLKISSETVKTHIHNVKAKFGVSRKSDLLSALLHLDFSGWD